MKSRPKPRVEVQQVDFLQLPLERVRAFTLLSTVLLQVIMASLFRELLPEEYGISLTFPLLMASTTLTILILLVTISLSFYYSTTMLSTLFLDVPLTILSIITVPLLGWDMSEELTAPCSNEIWGSHHGVVVCRLVKAMFSFTIVVAAGATATVALDILAIRRQLIKDAYNVRENSERKRGLLRHEKAESEPKRQ